MKLTSVIKFINCLCKDTKIKRSKPTQNSEVCVTQLSPNQQIFVREWVKQKRGAQPEDKNRERMTKDKSYVYMWLTTSLPEEASSYPE